MRIVMLGAPGSGKGTQAKMLESDYGFPQVSTGDLLRTAVAEGTELGRRAKAAMDAGELVSDEIVLGMIKERLSQPDAAAGYVLDGYPRNRQQAEDLEGVLEDMGQRVDRAVLMDVPFEILMKRLTGRRTCSKTGQLLNIYFSAQSDIDACLAAGGELVQRDDDNEETIRHRLEVYEQQTAPLVEYYAGRRLLETIAADGTVDEVYGRLQQSLGLSA